MLIKAGFKVAG